MLRSHSMTLGAVWVRKVIIRASMSIQGREAGRGWETGMNGIRFWIEFNATFSFCQIATLELDTWSYNLD